MPLMKRGSRSKMRHILLCLMIPVFFSTTVWGADRFVPDQFATIAEAIAASNDGDRVLVSQGTYEEFVDFSGKAIEVIGVDGPDLTILEGAASFLSVAKIDAPAGNSRLEGFTLQNGFGVSCGDPLTICGGGVVILQSSAVIENCIFVGNTSSNGGGLHAEESAVILTGCTFMSNFANQGAGVSIDGGSCEISQCDFIDNTAYAWGGGLFAGNEAELTIDDCNFTANSSESGGGFMMSGAIGTMSNCLIDGNQAFDEGGGGLFEQFANFSVSGLQVIQNTASDGGGLGITHFSTVDLVDSEISSNSADNDGGGIYSFENFSTYRRLRIVGNSADQRGGGMLLRFFGDPLVENCLILANQATVSGGGIGCAEDVSPQILHCTLDRNATLGLGGGIRADNLCFPTLVNCIIWRNRAQQETGVSTGPQSGFDLIHVLMQGADPDDPLVFQQDAELDDFGYPGECSAAIDEGTDEYPGLPATDIDGVIRPQGLRRDLGAHEAPGYGHCFVRGDCNGNQAVEIADALLVLGYLFNGEEVTGCVEACDFQDDGFVTVTDAIQTISLLFSGGSPPAQPFPFPGPDVSLVNSKIADCWVLP